MEICETARTVTGNLLDCFGPTLERDGYFVYKLENGYIGMTYNPSRRQFEHDEAERLQRYIDGRKDIEDPNAYFHTAYGDIQKRDQIWKAYYSEHWRRVRNSDRSAIGERRISWLSPVLNSRNEAYRCEWALKQYRNEANGRFPGTFNEVVSSSSVPVVIFQSARLDYDADAGRVSFGLSWNLPDDLGPSQIVPVSFYELQRYDARRAEYVTVASGQEASFRGRLGLDLLGNWRARAVNFNDIPGPWTDFAVSEHDVGLGVQKLVKVADVTAELLDTWTGEVRLRWSVDNSIPGVRYEVKRQGINGKHAVTDVGRATQYRETVIVDEATSYQYSVRAVLDGVSGTWQSGGGQSRCVVGGVAPGSVVSLFAECLSDGSIRVRWNAPEWGGYDTIQGYCVETISDGGALDYASVRSTNSWYDADSKADYLSDVWYRVRPWSAMGCGPWSEAIHVASADRCQSIRSALPSSKQLQLLDAGRDHLSFQWNHQVGNGLSYDLEIDTSEGTIGYSATEPPITVPVDWLSMEMMTYRSRPVRRSVGGDWSEPIGIKSAKDYESAWRLTWPEEVSVGLVVVDTEHDSPSIVAVWSRQEPEFLARGAPDFGVPLLGRVMTKNKGGLEVSWCGIRCFVPASRVMGNADRLDILVGKFIGLSVLESKLRRIRLIRRAYVDRRELVCAEVPLTPSRRQSSDSTGSSIGTRTASAEATHLMAIGSIVVHQTLGHGTVVWLGNQSAKIEFCDSPELGAVLCRVRELIVVEAAAATDSAKST